MMATMLNMKRQIKFGCIPDAPDPRDFVSERHLKAPAQLSLSYKLPWEKFPIFDQGQMGSCTANAAIVAFRHAAAKVKRRRTNLSRLYLYYKSREYIGTTDNDSGATIRDTFKSMMKHGIAPESLHPYTPSYLTLEPSKEASEAAKSHRIMRYSRVAKNVEQIKQTLYADAAVVFGFLVHEQFMSGWSSRMMPMPTASEGTIGGHAAVIVGYADTLDAFLIQNSWGRKWKDGGYFWMPYEFVESDRCFDFWIIEELAPK